MPFYVYVWIGAIVLGLFVITAKLTSKHAISNPWLFNFLLTTVNLLFTVPVAIYFHAVLPNGWVPIIYLATPSYFLKFGNIYQLATR